MKKAAKEYETCEIMRTVSLHSFGIFVLITFIVILILSEGDGLDFDFGDTGSGNSKNLSDHTSKKEEENNEENFKKRKSRIF